MARTAERNANLYLTLHKGYEGRLASTCLITEEEKRFLYAHLEWRSGQYARLLKNLGIRTGDRVCVETYKTPELVFMYMACLRSGIIFVPIHPSEGRSTIEKIVLETKPAALVTTQTSAPLYRSVASALHTAPHLLTLGEESSLARRIRFMLPSFRIAQRQQDDIAYILYTSGTTGTPKGAVITHGSARLATEALAALWDIRPHDTLLHTLSLSHGYGLTALNLALSQGAEITFLRGFLRDRVVRFLPRATIFMGIPAHYRELVEDARVGYPLLRRMRLLISGTNPLPHSLFDAFFEKTGKKIIDRYGMTESHVNASASPGMERPGSCGRPIPGVEIRIVDEKRAPVPVGEPGSIEMKSPYLFVSYWNDAKETRAVMTEDGFFITGDIGRQDVEGYLYLLGRSKEVVTLCNGAKVFPREIEEHLDTLEGVARSAAFGVEEGLAERLVAAVTTTKRLTGEDIRQALRGRVSAQKVPEEILILQTLPTNAAGKVQKHLLKDLYLDSCGRRDAAGGTRDRVTIGMHT